jgi:hypothetical protein
MRRWWGLCWLALAIGCGEGGPPLDELPLRDALRVAPAVVAGLPPEARARLSARLEAARTVNPTSDRLGAGTPTPEALVGALDRQRVERQADPLLVGIIADGLARPIADPSQLNGASLSPLPPIEGEPAGDTASLEARALDGGVGVTVRALLAASGSRHLWRVTGWPIGAIAIDGTVYVNGSWLAALAPDDGGAVDGGSDGPAPSREVPSGLGAAAASGSLVSSPAPSDLGVEVDASAEPDGGPSPADAGAEQAPAGKPLQIAEAASGSAGDGGVIIIVPPTTSPPPPPPNGPGLGDACGAGADACDSTDTSSCDGTDDGSDDSCGGNTDDGSDDSCSMPPDDGGGCQVARGGHRTRYGTVLWMMAPLGFLLGRRP